MFQILSNSAQLGQIIADRRKARKLSQRVLATKLAISQNRLSELENDPGKFTLERLLVLANILGLELIIQDKKPVGKSPKIEW
jgi:HTH-type transcriptional regulator/antitoxin HipB